MTMRALLIGIAVLALSTFGVFAGVPVQDHHTGCPFAPLDAQACVTLASHITHWQTATHGIHAAPLVLVYVLAALYVVNRVRRIGRLAVHIPAHVSRQPSLMQSLFANGILHPKAP